MNILLFLLSGYIALLGMMSDVTTREAPPGKYYHFGLKNGILRSLVNFGLDCIHNMGAVQLNIDGISLTKDSRSQFWPVQWKLKGPKCPYCVV